MYHIGAVKKKIILKDYINELIKTEKLVGENESIKVTKEKVIDTPFSDKNRRLIFSKRAKFWSRI